MSQGPSSRPHVDSNADVVVVVDFKQAESYLLIEPLLKLAEELSATLDWRYLEAPTRPKPIAVADDTDRGTRHLALRAQYSASELDRYAEARGLDLSRKFGDLDTTRAGAALRVAARTSEPLATARFVRALFNGHWAGTIDLEDAAALSATLSDCGVSANDDWSSEEALAELRQGEAQLRASGVVQTPALYCRGELMVGRAHLPMLRWLLTDRAGPAPI